MPRLAPKTHILSLRLSEREFDALKKLHAEHGTRSISDFVRSRITTESSGSLELRIQEIDGKLSLLDGEVTRLTRLLESRHD